MVKDIPRAGVIYRLQAAEEQNPDGDVLAFPNELQSKACLVSLRNGSTHAAATTAVFVGNEAITTPSAGAFD
jgi:hypothetical protein